LLPRSIVFHAFGFLQACSRLQDAGKAGGRFHAPALGLEQRKEQAIYLEDVFGDKVAHNEVDQRPQCIVVADNGGPEFGRAPEQRGMRPLVAGEMRIIARSEHFFFMLEVPRDVGQERIKCNLHLPRVRRRTLLERGGNQGIARSNS
jgi:hypothetical protein